MDGGWWYYMPQQCQCRIVEGCCCEDHDDQRNHGGGGGHVPSGLGSCGTDFCGYHSIYMCIYNYVSVDNQYSNHNLASVVGVFKRTSNLA